MLTLLKLHMELLLSAMRSFRNLNFSLNRYRVSEFLTAASGLGHKSSACNTWLFEIFTGDTREHFGKYGMDMREFFPPETGDSDGAGHLSRLRIF